MLDERRLPSLKRLAGDIGPAGWQHLVVSMHDRCGMHHVRERATSNELSQWASGVPCRNVAAAGREVVRFCRTRLNGPAPDRFWPGSLLTWLS